ncbi:DUF58 domain-containing protein [Saccharobesus litoralis]|uniref:DUF58 domain-containing protein n=1 Tax=Saccharobesus litoralis TaxID=2172099 RepID=A0A2S0VSJ2_9ALTE|nr:DUF58 domain-containing protein [Saccharobesus litoralis]AWB67153.1 DUF58 domain-containing protein [Saccharobesus litoralis]
MLSTAEHLDPIYWLEQIKSNGVQSGIHELLYYRGKTSLLDLTPRIANQAKLAGNYLAKSKGRGMEFDEVRHYQTGDDPRMIDWRVTARTGETYTKLFREEKERPIFILTDLSQTMQFGSQLLYKSVQASHVAALLAWNGKKRGDRVGGVVFNGVQHQELKPRSRQQGVLQYLHALESLSQNTDNRQISDSATSFAEACARLRRLAKPGSLVNLVSDFALLDDQALQHLSQLARHCELRAFRILDPLEVALPQVQLRQSLQVKDGDKSGLLTLGDDSLSREYRQEAAFYLTEQSKKLKQCRCQIIDISAGQTLEEQLKHAR